MASAPPIHVISLARTPDRLESFRGDNGHLQDWRVFPAVDGTVVDAETRATLGDTALWSAGSVGVALSMLALFRLCVERGEPLTICEDDAVLRGDFVATSAARLGAIGEYDFVLWGWNFDAVIEAEVTPGVSAGLVGDQASLRANIARFQQDRTQPALLKLRKALGMPCYTISPRGASALLARAVPASSEPLGLPLMPHRIQNVTFDVNVARLYGEIDAYVAMPPLAVTRNDWRVSTIRPAIEPTPPAQALDRTTRLLAAGRIEPAVETLRVAAAAWPSQAELWTRLGQLLAEQGHLAAASAALERVLPLDAAAGTALYNLARVRLLQGRAQGALELLDQALASAPGFALAHANRGVALLALGRSNEALAAFAAAVALDPSLLEGRRGVAAARLALGDLAGAAEAQATAVELAPGDLVLIDGLASLQLQLAAKAQSEGDLVEAVRLTALAACVPGRRVEALITGSDLMERLGRYQESWEAAHEAAQAEPASPQALNNLGVACLRLNRPMEAERAYRAALRRTPDYADAHHGLAFALLKQGRFSEGWPEYEWRLRTPAAEAFTRSFDRPLWRGDAQPELTLLMVAEQGLGDTLQAACLIAEARLRVGAVVVQAPATLLRLLRRLPGVDAVVEEGAEQPPHDLWLPLMSLPGRLHMTQYRQPPAKPPLAADPALMESWRPRLPAGCFRIGVVWQGNPAARVEYGRSFPLEALGPLAALSGVVLVSLQKGFGCEQLADQPPGWNIVDLGEPYRAGDFDDTAAIVANLDLVVCCDTAVAHLAGALGRPVWIALGDNPDWRWPSSGPATSWYASARLFHRQLGEAWSQLFTRMALELDVSPERDEHQ